MAEPTGLATEAVMAKAPLATDDDRRVIHLPQRPRPPPPARSRPFLVDLAVILAMGLLCLWFYGQMNPPPQQPGFPTPIPSDGASPI